VFHISIWGLGALFGGLSPPKPPGGDGTEMNTHLVKYNTVLKILLISLNEMHQQSFSRRKPTAILQAVYLEIMFFPWIRKKIVG